MDGKFTAGHNRFVPAGDGHRSATFDTGNNTVASRFDKASCMDGTAGSTAPLGVVQVVVVTDEKKRGQAVRQLASAISWGSIRAVNPDAPQKGDWNK
jgi:hypothetical protein